MIRVEHGDMLQVIPRLVADGVGCDAGVHKQQRGNEKRRQKSAALWANRRPEIDRLYSAGDWSLARLADHYGVSQQGIGKVLARMGIPTKSKGRSGEQNGRFKDGSQSTIYRTMVEKDACSSCGACSDLCIHHNDDNHTNNTPSNLVVLCMSCHSRLHKQRWWDNQKASAS